MSHQLPLVLLSKEQSFISSNSSFFSSSLPQELNLTSSYLFGEITFLILGLKDIVLISHFTPGVFNQFLNTVLLDKEVISLLKQISPNFELGHKHLPSLRTPNDDLPNSFILYNGNQESISSPKVQQFIELCLSLKSNQALSEMILATMLNYPVSLPNDPKAAPLEKFYEIGYFMRDKEKVLLTSYGAFESQLEKCKKHFEHYQVICKDVFEMEMKITCLSE